MQPAIGDQGGRKLDALQAMIERLPDRASQIRERYRRDQAFRAVCDDHRAAAITRARLAAAEPIDAARLAEYRVLAAELVAEAAAMLAKVADPNGRSP